MKIFVFNRFDISENYRKSLLTKYERADHLIKSNCHVVKGRMWGNNVEEIVPSIVLWSKVCDVPLEDFEIVEIIMQEGRGSDKIFFVMFNKKQHVKSLLDFFVDDEFNHQLFKKIPKHSVNTTSYYWEVSHNNNITEKFSSVFVWVRDNCRGNVYKEGSMWFFEEETDATAFKLYWLDDKK